MVLRGLKTIKHKHLNHKIIVKNILINGWVSSLTLVRLLASHNKNKTLKTIKKL